MKDLKELVLSTITKTNLKKIEEHIDGKWLHTAIIWKVLILIMWLEKDSEIC